MTAMRLVLQMSLGLAALLIFAGPSRAQQNAAAYPSQTVRIIVPFSAGSQTDILARAYAEKLHQIWKKDVIVENRPGIAGTATVAKAPADGHTLLLTSNGHTIVHLLNKALPFDPLKDFAPVAHIATSPGILVVSPDSGITSLAQFIDVTKQRSGNHNYASAGLGSASSIGLELLKSAAGIELYHIPYRGLPEAHTSIMRQDALVFMTFFSAGGDLIQSGKLAPIAVTTSRRLAVLPEIPTVREAGLTDYVYEPWFGLLAPAGTDLAIIEKINRNIADISQQPDTSGMFGRLGVTLISSSQTEFARLLSVDAERFTPLFANVK